MKGYIVILVLFALLLATGCSNSSEPTAPVAPTAANGDNVGQGFVETLVSQGYAPAKFSFTPTSFPVQNTVPKANLQLTIGTQDNFVWKTAYYSINGRDWTPITLTGQAASSSGNWLKTLTGQIVVPGSALSSLTLATGEQTHAFTENAIIIYSCKRTGATFDDCSSYKWQVSPFTIVLNAVVISCPSGCVDGTNCAAIGTYKGSPENRICNSAKQWQDITAYCLAQNKCAAASSGQCYADGAEAAGRVCDGTTGTWSLLPSVAAPTNPVHDCDSTEKPTTFVDAVTVAGSKNTCHWGCTSTCNTATGVWTPVTTTNAATVCANHQIYFIADSSCSATGPTDKLAK